MTRSLKILSKQRQAESYLISIPDMPLSYTPNTLSSRTNVRDLLMLPLPDKIVLLPFIKADIYKVSRRDPFGMFNKEGRIHSIHFYHF
ncbi:hypothetical protein [Rhodohalobacter sp. 614A]|uniref:hypothetical protein n=1 Tax=Rhodohalobacter sp. 614A TaxID=2908649 RepID=UPI001F44CF61|nr:hypothetical protein [Rhodohalobacter sp. 614A]